MKNTLAVRLVFLFVAYLVTKCDSFPSPVPGGWEQISPNSAEARRIAELGLEYFVDNSDVNRPPSSIMEVTKAERQIVNGRNYRVDFEAVYAENDNNFDNWFCHTEAYLNLNGNVQIQESMCYIMSLV